MNALIDNTFVAAALKSTLVLAMAWALLVCMRRSSAAARHWICLAALVSLPLLPAFSLLLPAWRALPADWKIEQIKTDRFVNISQADLPTQTIPTQPLVAPTEMRPAVSSPVLAQSLVPEQPRLQAKPPRPIRMRVNWQRAGLLIWGAGMFIALVPMVWGRWSLRRLERQSRCEARQPWLSLLQKLSNEIGLKRRVILLRSPHRQVPMTWGLWGSKVLMPDEADEWTEQRQRMALLHELAHVQRWDYLGQLAGRVCCSVYWFNPLSWLTARRMVVERERACDDIVLRHQAAPSDYAQQILEVSAALSLGSAAVAMARPSNLESRIRSILDATINRAVLTRRQAGAILIICVLIVLPLSMLRAQERAGETPKTNTVPAQERLVTCTATNAPFTNVLAMIAKSAGLGLAINENDVVAAGIKLDRPVSFNFTDEPIKYAMGYVFRSVRNGTSNARIIVVNNSTNVPALVTWSINNDALIVERVKPYKPEGPDWLQPYHPSFDNDHKLRWLYLQNGIEDEVVEKLKTFGGPREIHMEPKRPLKLADVAKLAELPTLESLEIYGTGCGADACVNYDVLHVFAAIKSLRRLSVTESSLKDQDVRALETMTQLTNLDLGGNQLTDSGVKYLAGLTNLQSLAINNSQWVHSHMNITDSGLKYLTNLVELRSLNTTRLNVTGFPVALPKLQSATLSSQPQVNGKLTGLPNLKSLMFSGNQVSDESLDKILESSGLESLHLQYTPITDAGLKRIASIKSLKKLRIDSAVITDDGIAALVDGPPLVSMNLRITGISGKMFDSLAKIKTIEDLTIHGSGQSGSFTGSLFAIDDVVRLKDLPKLRKLEIMNLTTSSSFLPLRHLSNVRVLTFMMTSISQDESELLQAAMPYASVTRSSAGGMIIRDEPERAPLPKDTLYISGRAVDDVTGAPISDVELQFGSENTNRPGTTDWGQAPGSPIIEICKSNHWDAGVFWGETFRTGQVRARILADGYQPTVFATNHAPERLTNFQVRMKRSGFLEGTVLDYQGKPVAGVWVYIAKGTGPYSVNSGALRVAMDNPPKAVTSQSGRFALPNANGTKEMLLVSSPDGQMIYTSPGPDPGQPAVIKLPQPGSLEISYDISNDLPTGQFYINHDSKPGPNEFASSFNVLLTNGGKLLLTNLSPGDYRVARRKTFHIGDRGDDLGRWWFAFFDSETFTIKPGEVQHVATTRPTGASLHCAITNLAKLDAVGAHIFIYPDDHSNSLSSLIRNPLRPADGLTCARDGRFETARLRPGDYVIIAGVFTGPNDRVRMDPNYVGIAKTTVPASGDPQPVEIGLILFADIPK